MILQSAAESQVNKVDEVDETIQGFVEDLKRTRRMHDDGFEEKTWENAITQRIHDEQPKQENELQND